MYGHNDQAHGSYRSIVPTVRCFQYTGKRGYEYDDPEVMVLKGDSSLILPPADDWRGVRLILAVIRTRRADDSTLLIWFTTSG